MISIYVNAGYALVPGQNMVRELVVSMLVIVMKPLSKRVWYGD